MSQAMLSILQGIPDEEKIDMGDIEFLSIKEFDGKLRQDNSVRTTTGDLATLTASGGKDMYLAKAKINVINNNLAAGAVLATVVLKINGVIVETAEFVFVNFTGDTISSVGESDYEFIVIGFSVLTTQIIKLELTVATNAKVTGSIVCFEEDTGITPKV